MPLKTKHDTKNNNGFDFPAIYFLKTVTKKELSFSFRFCIPHWRRRKCSEATPPSAAASLSTSLRAGLHMGLFIQKASFKFEACCESVPWRSSLRSAVENAETRWTNSLTSR